MAVGAVCSELLSGRKMHYQGRKQRFVKAAAVPIVSSPGEGRLPRAAARKLTGKFKRGSASVSAAFRDFRANSQHRTTQPLCAVIDQVSGTTKLVNKFRRRGGHAEVSRPPEGIAAYAAGASRRVPFDCLFRKCVPSLLLFLKSRALTPLPFVFSLCDWRIAPQRFLKEQIRVEIATDLLGEQECGHSCGCSDSPDGRSCIDSCFRKRFFPLQHCNEVSSRANS